MPGSVPPGKEGRDVAYPYPSPAYPSPAYPSPARPDVSRLPALHYVLPLRWADDAGLAELTDYLLLLARVVRVTVVDGSPPSLFAAHRGLALKATAACQ